MLTTVTKQPVTVPMELIQQLSLKPGTQLEWSIDSDGTLVARPVRSRSEQVRKAAGMGQAWLNPNQSPVAELIAERQAATHEELHHVPA
jgi:antitoxin component of MazEF toxin-antitoxin module